MLEISHNLLFNLQMPRSKKIQKTCAVRTYEAMRGKQKAAGQTEAGNVIIYFYKYGPNVVYGKVGSLSSGIIFL